MATAMQESKLVNLHGGPAGAYGVFQQTPPSWGTIAQVENPSYAATAFYNHLLKIPGWQSMASPTPRRPYRSRPIPPRTPSGSSRPPSSSPL
jgi:hypothetical protein